MAGSGVMRVGDFLPEEKPFVLPQWGREAQAVV